MKCNQCGAELKIQREEYCKDVNGNPMYRDCAYCDNCKTKTPLQNNQNPNNFPPNFVPTQNITNNKPPKKKLKTWQIVLIVIVAMAFIGTIFSDDTTSDKTNKTTSKQEEKTAVDTKQKGEHIKKSTERKASAKPKATKKPKPTLSPKQVKAKEKQKAKREQKKFIAACKDYSYKKVMRNPSKYIGKKIKIKCQINQIQEEGIFTKKYYRCYSYSGYGIYAENEYVIFDERVTSSPKLLDNDVITVYGTIEEPEEVTRALTGTNDEVFTINMKYVKLHSK